MGEIITIIGVGFGGISSLTSILGLSGQYRKMNTFDLLRNGLNEIESSPLGNIMPEDDEILLDLLNSSLLIMPLLKVKITHRFIVTLIAIISGSFFIRLVVDVIFS